MLTIKLQPIIIRKRIPYYKCRFRMKDVKKDQKKQAARFCKTGEAASILGLTPATIRAAVRRGDLPGIRIGVQFLIRRDAIREHPRRIEATVIYRRPLPSLPSGDELERENEQALQWNLRYTRAVRLKRMIESSDEVPASPLDRRGESWWPSRFPRLK